jgi:hypothetical protein
MNFFTFRKKKDIIRVSSVAELCDLSRYNDNTLTKSCRNMPTYANTMSSPNDGGGTSNSAPVSTNVASTFDQNSQKAISADVHNSEDQSCQDDAVGRHKIVKQISTSSIQVSEGK